MERFGRATIPSELLYQSALNFRVIYSSPKSEENQEGVAAHAINPTLPLPNLGEGITRGAKADLY